MSDLSNQAQKLLDGFCRTVDRMKSAYSKSDKMMSVWADDLYAVEAVMSFLETIRDARAQGEEPWLDADLSEPPFAFRFEYADKSASEVLEDGRAFIVNSDGRRYEPRGKITSNIRRLIGRAIIMRARATQRLPAHSGQKRIHEAVERWVKEPEVNAALHRSPGATDQQKLKWQAEKINELDDERQRLAALVEQWEARALRAEAELREANGKMFAALPSIDKA